MAKNKALELTIKISGKVDKSLTTAISQATGQVSGIATTFSRIGTVGLAAMGALATGTVAAIADCTKAAESFESQMADVVKYVDGLADATGRISDKIAGETLGTILDGNTYAENYAVMTDALLDLSTQIPMTAEDLTRLAAAAGQSGKSLTDLIQYDEAGNITGFLRDVAMMGTAMDISADQAGDWAAKWEKAFNMNHDEIMVLADQINYLGANSATTAAEIANAVNSAASLGQIAGVDVATTAALADAMLATGVSSDRVGTSIKRTFTNMSKGSSATKAMKEQWEELGFTAEGVALAMQQDSIGTLNAVFEAIGNLPDERQVAALSTLFGQWAIEGTAKVVGNMDVFTDALAMVSDPALYGGSMEREFIIKSSTTEAIDMMMGNAFQALKIDFGTEFLPVKKTFSLAMIDLMNSLRENMPELKELGSTLAEIAAKGVAALSEALPKALPYIQKALDYVNNNGPQVASTIGKIAAVLVGMKFAPAIEGVLGGVGSLLFGKQTGGGIGSLLGIGGAGGGRTGGLFNGIASLWRGGRNFATDAGTVLNIGADAASMSGGGFFSRLITGITGGVSGALNIGGINSRSANARNTAWGNISAATRGASNWVSGIATAGGNLRNTIFGAAANAHASSLLGQGGFGQNLIANLLKPTSGQSLGAGISGLLGSIVSPATNALANTGVGRYVGGVGSALGNFSGNASGLFATLIGTKAPELGTSLMGSVASGITGTLKSGVGLLGSVWGPIASGFGSLFAGAAPVIGVISGIIAVMSILGDHMEDIRGIIGNVFGEKGLAVFDLFAEKISGVKDFIMGLFEPGAMTELFAPLQESITNLFGENAGAAFGGIVTILESIMGIVGQIVTFATTVVKPIIEEVFRFIVDTVLPILLQTFATAAPAIAGIIDGLGTAIMTAMTFIGEALQTVLPIIEAIVTAILNVASVVIPIILDAINAFVAQLAPIIEGIKGVFDGLIQFITGVFSGNWEQAWEGVKQIFSSAFDALAGLLKAPINAVISIINGVINNINGLGITIPDWVPFIGGQSFTVNIPTIPMLARGGFTNGPSIAGEAGQEAVISFLPGVRAANIATWLQAGRMLGMDRLLNIGGNYRGLDDIDPSDGWPGGGGGGTFTFAPQITIQGNADRATIDAALEEAEARFQRWWEQMQRRQFRTAY